MSPLSSKMCRLKTNHTPSLLRRRSPFSRHTLMMKIVHSKRQRWWPRLKGCEVGLLIRRERRQQVWWVVVENPKHLRTRGTFCFSSAPSPLRATRGLKRCEMGRPFRTLEHHHVLETNQQNIYAETTDEFKLKRFCRLFFCSAWF